MALRDFLDTRRAKKGEKHNITGMSKTDKGIYYITDDDYNNFLSLYHTHVFVERKTSSLLEKHAAFTPILIDLDFKYDSKDITRSFTNENIRLFVSMYAKAFFHFLDWNEPLRFFVQLKSSPTLDRGKKKDGIHIICPDISLPYNIPFTLREYLLEQNIIGKCFPNIENPASDVFDKSVIQRNNWFLYGASKPDKEAYSISSCFLARSDGGLEETTWNETKIECIRLFSIHHARNVETHIRYREDVKDEWAMWESIANPSQSVSKRKPALDDNPKSLIETETNRDNRSVTSEGISKLLNLDGMSWDVSEMDNGYKLSHKSLRCLVLGDVDHTTPGHSCIFVQRTHANAFCFSHNTKKLSAPLSAALWKLLANEGVEELIDDVYACRKFVESMGNEIHREGETVYIFNTENGLWESSETALMAAVHRHKHNLIFYTVSDAGKKTCINYGGSTKHIKNMLVHLKAILRNETFMSSNAETALNYLLFEDGIFHIPTQVFTPGFDMAKVFTARIPRKFPSSRNRALEEEINQTLFVSPFKNELVGRYMKMRLARSIAGCYHDKKFVCALGDADSSKGTITKAMRNAFGGYVVEWNANHLKYNPHSGADEAKKLSWIFQFEHTRLAISNESRMDKTAMDGNLVKTLSSGGDEMTARKTFGDETPIVIRASFFYLGNDMPEITPKDSGIQTRIRMIRFTKRFVDNPASPNELPADPMIKHKIATTEWCDSLFWLIMDAYGFPTTEPEEVLEETKEWVSTDSIQIKTALEERFVIDLTDTSADNYVSSRDIIAHLKTMNLNLSDQKIGRELGKIGLIKDDKKIQGKTLKIWKGIKE